MKIFAPLAAVALFAPTVLSAAEVKAGELVFDAPDDWKAAGAPSPMRAAQLEVPGEAGAAELVFFFFGPQGAGGVEANVERWFKQFKEPQDQIEPATEKATAGDHPVTFVSAKGTYLAGPPMGQKVEQPDSRLLGAIVEDPAGPVFIKLTGPAATVEAATAAFKTMVTSAK